VLLAENAAGYRNLLRPSSLAQTEGFYYKPRVDKELLEALGRADRPVGLPAGGDPARSGDGRGRAGARDPGGIPVDLRDGRFFLEIQDNGLPEQDRMNRASSSWRGARERRWSRRTIATT
jgi:DNA polymerase-3 subunit alpha